MNSIFDKVQDVEPRRGSVLFALRRPRPASSYPSQTLPRSPYTSPTPFSTPPVVFGYFFPVQLALADFVLYLKERQANPDAVVAWWTCGPFGPLISAQKQTASRRPLV
jgi:hypothetical protein